MKLLITIITILAITAINCMSQTNPNNMDTLSFHPEFKTDTVTVDVLCNNNGVLTIEKRQMERFFELRMVSSPATTPSVSGFDVFSASVCISKTDWVVIGERFLESVEGCYLLTPLSK